MMNGPEIMMGDPAALVTTEADRSVTKYIESGWVASDRITFGLGAGAPLAAGATQTFVQQTNTPFKALKVMFPSQDAPGVFVNSVRIGSIELVDGAAVPIQIWSEVSMVNEVSWVTADTSQQISFNITNTTGVAVPIAVALYGIRLRK